MLSGAKRRTKLGETRVNIVEFRCSKSWCKCKKKKKKKRKNLNKRSKRSENCRISVNRKYFVS